MSQCHNLNFYAKIDDHGSCQCNMVQILARWWRPVALSVAMDLLHWVMHTSLHRRITMAIKTASKGGVFFNIADVVTDGP